MRFKYFAPVAALFSAFAHLVTGDINIEAPPAARPVTAMLIERPSGITAKRIKANYSMPMRKPGGAGEKNIMRMKNKPCSAGPGIHACALP